MQQTLTSSKLKCKIVLILQCYKRKVEKTRKKSTVKRKKNEKKKTQG